MKSNYLFKLLPFLSTFLLIVILNISNQKVDTKLRILIWNTPLLSLGTYLAISTGAGFILSFIVTSKLASTLKFKSNQTIQYKSENNIKGNNEYSFINFTNSNEKTLIERNINDPSPTMDAQFRVIGKTERYNNNYINDNNIQYEDSNNYHETYIDDTYMKEENNKNASNPLEKEISNDWNDDSFTNW